MNHTLIQNEPVYVEIEQKASFGVNEIHSEISLKSILFNFIFIYNMLFKVNEISFFYIFQTSRYK